jgi:Trk K+ transport system NAD-binding subunit
MFNIIIGVGTYTDLIANELLSEEKLVMIIDEKEKLAQYHNKTVIKTAINIKNTKLLQLTIESKNAGKVFIATEDDKLNLMLAEALKDYAEIYVIFKNEKYLTLAKGNYKTFCVRSIIKEKIREEMN